MSYKHDRANLNPAVIKSVMEILESKHEGIISSVPYPEEYYQLIK